MKQLLTKQPARLLFSDMEKSEKVNLTQRLINSTTGGEKGIGFLSRQETYREVLTSFDNLNARAGKLRLFNSDGAGYADSASALTSSHAIDATIRAYTDSIAGFFCKEVNLGQANALVNHFDTLEVLDDSIISPNVGPVDKTKLKRAPIKSTVATALDAFSLISGKRLVPKTIKITAFKVDGTIAATVIDDGTQLVAGAGVMTVAAIDYAVGTVSGTFAAGLAVTSVLIEASADITAEVASGGTRNHVKGRMVGIIMYTVPELLTYETNIIQSIAVSKALNVDMDVYLAERLAELYTIKINENVAKCIHDNYVGTTKAVDFSTPTFDNVRSYSDYFYNKYTEAGEDLVAKSYRSGTITAVLAGKKAVLPFKKLGQIGAFTKVVNPQMVGLIGYIDENVPVIRTDDIPDDTCYLVHKSSDGEIAPVLRGIFLPITATPEIGNPNMPLQVVGGLYYQEGMIQLYPQMVQKMTVANTEDY